LRVTKYNQKRPRNRSITEDRVELSRAIRRRAAGVIEEGRPSEAVHPARKRGPTRIK